MNEEEKKKVNGGGKRRNDSKLEKKIKKKNILLKNFQNCARKEYYIIINLNTLFIKVIFFMLQILQIYEI